MSWIRDNNPVKTQKRAESRRAKLKVGLAKSSHGTAHQDGGWPTTQSVVIARKCDVMPMMEAAAHIDKC